MVTPAAWSLAMFGDDVELGDLAALHGDGADTRDAVERRLQRVGGQLPELRLRERVRGEAVAENGKRGEGEAIDGDLARWMEASAALDERGVRPVPAFGTCPRTSRRRGSLRRSRGWWWSERSRRPGTLLTASSMGLVMVTCICSTGMTPLSTPMTTRGKFVSGKTAMGVL